MSKMDGDNVTEPNAALVHYLSAYCDVNALGPNWQSELRRTLETTKDKERANAFKGQLLRSINENGMTLQEFESATSQDFDDQGELRSWLIELWTSLYDCEPPVAN